MCVFICDLERREIAYSVREWRLGLENGNNVREFPWIRPTPRVREGDFNMWVVRGAEIERVALKYVGRYYIENQ